MHEMSLALEIRACSSTTFRWRPSRPAAEEALENARSINPDLEIFSISCFTDQDLEAWAAWLADRAAAAQESARRDR